MDGPIVFAGLGVMGGPMAGHLVRQGYEVIGYNRSPDKAKAWAETNGAAWCDDLTKACENAQALILCVGDDNDVEACVLNALKSLKAGSLIIDHTTISAHMSRHLNGLAKESSIDFYDAPVSGGQGGAQSGQLSIMVGGDEARFQEVVDLTRAYTRIITYLGEAGAGQLCKMSNQIAIAGVVQGISEAFDFCLRAGLDPLKVKDAIANGAAGSWQMSNRWHTMAAGEFDFGFAVDWMRKDLGIALEEATRNGAKLETTRLIDQFYGDIQALGGGRYDTSSLCLRLKDKT